MEKQTKILLGVGAAILAILILNYKKLAPQIAEESPSGSGGTMPMPDGGGGGIGIVQSPEGNLQTPVDTGKKTAVEPTTKPCEVIYHNCTPNPRIEIIQIPYDDEKCDRLIRYGGYQPDPPPCAPRGGDDMMMVAPMVAPMESLNFV
jgi:hypothetical protein